jgi:hypothetical protein
MHRLGLLLASSVVLLVANVGCSNSAGSQLRTSAPAETAAAALQNYDANKDGKIDAKELEASPALLEGLPRIDKNRDGAIDAAEMQARFETYERMSDVVGFDLAITANGRPLSGATVTFTPESFMGEGKQSYSGKTDDRGSTSLEGEQVKSMPGLPAGYYSVHVHSATGKYDVKLGCEVADDTPSPNRLAFEVVRPGRTAGQSR